MGWKHFSLLSKGFPYDFPCQIINCELNSVCHDSPGLLWRWLILKPDDIFTTPCRSQLRTISTSCKLGLTLSLSQASLPNRRDGSGKGNSAFCIPTRQLPGEAAWLSRREEPALQRAELWLSLLGSGHDLFHFTRSKECKLLHRFVNTVSVVFYGPFSPSSSSS